MTIDTKALRELWDQRATHTPCEVVQRGYLGAGLEADLSLEAAGNLRGYFHEEDARLLADLWNNAPALLATADRLAALEAENQRLRAAWDELSDAIQSTQSALDYHGPDWENAEGVFIRVAYIEDYMGIIEQHQEAIAAGSGE